MRRKKVFRNFLLSILLIVILFSFQSYAQPLVGEDDNYSKDVEINSEGEFYWTVYKNSSLDYSISVEVEGFSNWNPKVTPSKFVLSDDNTYEIITFEFKIPKYPDQEKRTGSINFIYRELNGTEKNTIEKKVYVNVVGIYEGKENTIFGGFTNPLPKPLNNPFGALILNIIIWLVFSLIIYFIIKYILVFLARKTKTEFDDAVVEIIRKPIILLVLLYGLIISVIRFGINVGYQASLYQIYFVIFVVIGIYVAYRVFDELLDEITKKKGGEKSNFGRVLKPIFKKVGVVVIVIGGSIFGLSSIGIEVTALLAGAGVLGLVLAFAAQDTLSNYFSGIHLLLDRPFRIGDIIKIESGDFCRVDSIGMRSTKLYSIFDHDLIILPNNNIANQKIVNVVRPDTQIRNNVEVSVAYGSDLKKVKEILYDVTKDHPDVLKDKDHEILVRFTEFGDSGLKFMIIFWIDEVMNQWRVMSDIRNEIDGRFRKAGITVPFPQRTVWLKEDKNK